MHETYEFAHETQLLIIKRVGIWRWREEGIKSKKHIQTRFGYTFYSLFFTFISTFYFYLLFFRFSLVLVMEVFAFSHERMAFFN